MTIPGDFDLRMHVPEGPLSESVARVFFARGHTPHGRERILPSTGAVLLCVLGAPLRMTAPGADGARDVRGAWITGPHERPIINEPTGETHVVGVVFRPLGLWSLTKRSVEPFTDRLVPATDVAPAMQGAPRLLSDLTGCEDGDDKIDAAVAWLEAAGAAAQPPGWARAVHALVQDSSPIAQIQEQMGVSRRYFTQQIRERTGLTPKSLQRIARMRRMLHAIDARRPIRWSSEAVGAGYFDQPHAIRDFRRFTGMTPTEYVARRRAAWGHDVEPGEATNFVPEVVR